MRDFSVKGRRATLPLLSAVSGDERVAGDARILVVDEEAIVLEFVCQALDREGYRVIGASGFSEALEAIDNVWLIISEVELAGRSGIELMESARADRPLLPVVCMSWNHAALGEASRRGADAVLIKPFGLSELRAVLQLMRVADRERGTP